MTLNATAANSAATYYLSPVADAGVSSGKPTTNTGTTTNFFVQSASGGTFGNERAWTRFDLSTLPAGLTISGAQLQLFNWKSTGAALAAEVDGATSDSWTETGLTWNTQPSFGSAIDTQTFAAGATNIYYNWNVGSFVQAKAAGNQLVSLVVKAVTEGSTDATSPSYAFDTREFGSTGPILLVQAAGSVASVQYYVRFSTDNSSWSAYSAAGAPVTAAPYALAYNFPNGSGYYQFYSVASDGQGHVQATPATAQATVQFVAAATQPQTITFTAPVSAVVGVTQTLAASASSGLAVAFSSQTPALCTVSGSVLTPVAVGTCVVEADQAGDGTWQAAPAVLANIPVSATSTQTITVDPVANTPLSAHTVTVNATASSGLTVTLTTQTPAVCSVSGNVATLLAVGTCTLQATQAGDASHAAATPVSVSFAVTDAASVSQVPTPPWALALLALGLALFVGARRRGGRLPS